MLSIKNLHVDVGGKEIIRGLDLEVNAGEVHAIMGPNGSGKSTLAHVLAGRDGYQVTEGKVLYEGADLLTMAPEERSREGLFLGFQYPVEIPGVNNTYFLKAALNAGRKHRGLDELDAMDFMQLVKEKLEILHIDDSLLQRPVNVGFSGGEKKRNEVFQMAVLEPRLALLDETDSGLDIDALKDVAQGVNVLRSPQRAIVLITHYQTSADRSASICGSMLFSSPHPLLPLLPLRETRLFASLLPIRAIRAIRGRSSSLGALTAPGRRAYAVGRTRATRAKTRVRVWCREVDKEKPIWLTRGKGTKARENSRRRASSVQRRSGKQREKRRASRCELGSARDCHVPRTAGHSGEGIIFVLVHGRAPDPQRPPWQPRRANHQKSC